jgi:hypothetical protein
MVFFLFIKRTIWIKISSHKCSSSINFGQESVIQEEGRVIFDPITNKDLFSSFDIFFCLHNKAFASIVIEPFDLAACRIMVVHICHRHQCDCTLPTNCNSKQSTLHKNAHSIEFFLSEIKFWIKIFQRLVFCLVKIFSLLCFYVQISSFNHVHQLLIKHGWEFIKGLRHGVKEILELSIWFFPL